MAPMSTQRFEFAAVCLNDYIYAIAGRSGFTLSSVQNTMEKFDPCSRQWSYVREMKNERFGHSACILREKIFVIGGINADGNMVKEIEIYDPKQDECVVSKFPESLKYSFLCTGVVTI